MVEPILNLAISFLYLEQEDQEYAVHTSHMQIFRLDCWYHRSIRGKWRETCSKFILIVYSCGKTSVMSYICLIYAYLNFQLGIYI